MRLKRTETNESYFNMITPKGKDEQMTEIRKIARKFLSSLRVENEDDLRKQYPFETNKIGHRTSLIHNRTRRLSLRDRKRSLFFKEEEVKLGENLTLSLTSKHSENNINNNLNTQNNVFMLETANAFLANIQLDMKLHKNSYEIDDNNKVKKKKEKIGYEREFIIDTISDRNRKFGVEKKEWENWLYIKKKLLSHKRIALASPMQKEGDKREELPKFKTSMTMDLVLGSKLEKEKIVYSYKQELEPHSHEILEPLFLDKSKLGMGKFRTVTNLKCYKLTILPFVRRDTLKYELNEKWKKKFSHIISDKALTLSKIIKFKYALLQALIPQDLQNGEELIELSTLSLGWTLFEKLIHKQFITAENYLVCGSSCIILAFKFLECFGDQLSILIEKICNIKSDKIKAQSIFRAEVEIIKVLKFSLHLSYTHFEPHFDSFLRMLDMHIVQYLGKSNFDMFKNAFSNYRKPLNLSSFKGKHDLKRRTPTMPITRKSHT